MSSDVAPDAGRAGVDHSDNVDNDGGDTSDVEILYLYSHLLLVRCKFQHPICSDLHCPHSFSIFH